MTDLSAIEWEVRRIGPADAADMLSRIAASGHVDKLMLEAFERDMRCGRWLLNGAPIIISADDQVLDGRARLHACVRSGNAFETLIVKGIKKGAFETIDSIRKRTLADVLSIRSEIHGRSLGAALRIIWSYQAGAAPGTGKAPGTTALLSILEQHPEIRDSVIPALRAMPLLPHGCGIALHYLANRTNPEKADQFIAQLGEPVSTNPHDPVVQLRAALEGLRGQGGARKQTYILAIAIKAWNAFSRGKSIKHLRFGAERESFPRMERDPSWGPLGESVERDRRAPMAPETTLRVRVVMVTPEMAEAMLADRGPNRHVSAPVINKYARDMLAGRWQLNGQTIKIARDGRLLDGQHRLEAAKKAKCAFPAIIVEGLAQETFASLDIGRRRSVSDILRERGESLTIILASALRWLWMIENGVILAANSSPTNGELLDVLGQHPEIRTSIKQVAAIREIMGSGIAAALHRTFADKDTVRADEFFARLIDGVQLAEQSPIRHLRERLIRTRSSHRVRLAEAERVAISIKAWNAYRDDRPVQLLIWRNRGAAREPLPAVM
ncbi:MAG: hypothetical protein IIZ38_18970 [Sphingomonas sp.]|uniref:hypothetical protein n=1 Tax=Sphingomonas sp. TaxID=28214 RepID=UPI0025CD5355|nr:hypothetical protein [Sphingomonas sp.]MBQ1500393.1 hypothetical protein [Sphingomonas sp.]MBQ8102664.1 hypothetical protein [Afipia sp.]